MSELSDTLDDILKNLGGDGPEPVRLAHVHGKSENPFEDALLLHHRNDAMVVLRRAYRHHTGQLFPTTEEALEGTQNKVLSEFVPVLITLFADFVQLGGNTSPAIHLCTLINRPDLLAQNGMWRDESTSLVKTISEDEDAVHLFLNYTRASAHALSHITGYMREEAEPDHINLVWNLWGMVFTSVFVAFSKVGHILGVKWAAEARAEEDRKIVDQIAAEEFSTEEHDDA